MAKIMVTPQPNVLKKFLRAEGKTSEEVADTLQMGRATLRRINDGKPVKDETLRKVADHLRKPVSYFLSERPQDASPDQSSSKLVIERDFGNFTSASILLRRLDGKDLRSIARNFPIDWTLRVSKLSSTAADTLRAIENMLFDDQEENSDEIVITTPGDNGLMSTRSGRRSLSSLIERLERTQSFDDLLRQLNEEGVFLLGSNFIYWRCETTEEYAGGDVAQIIDNYSSEFREKIVVQDSNVATTRVSVIIGKPPPTRGNENGRIVRVDGSELRDDFDLVNYYPF